MPEDKARKRAVRARMADTGERYTAAARKLGADHPEDPALAERDWSTIARVRITKPYRAGSVSPWDEHRFAVGDEREMNQHGRAGRPVERDAWWSSFDIDGAFIIPAGHVEVLEITSESAPTFAAAALPAGKVAEMFGPGAAGWAELGILTVPGIYDFEIRAASGELLGLIERATGADYDPPHPREPVTYPRGDPRGRQLPSAPAAVLDALAVGAARLLRAELIPARPVVVRRLRRRPGGGGRPSRAAALTSLPPLAEPEVSPEHSRPVHEAGHSYLLASLLGARLHRQARVIAGLCSPGCRAPPQIFPGTARMPGWTQRRWSAW